MNIGIYEQAETKAQLAHRGMADWRVTLNRNGGLLAQAPDGDAFAIVEQSVYSQGVWNGEFHSYAAGKLESGERVHPVKFILVMASRWQSGYVRRALEGQRLDAVSRGLDALAHFHDDLDLLTELERLKAGLAAMGMLGHWPPQLIWDYYDNGDCRLYIADGSDCRWAEQEDGVWVFYCDYEADRFGVKSLSECVLTAARDFVAEIAKLAEQEHPSDDYYNRTYADALDALECVEGF